VNEDRYIHTISGKMVVLKYCDVNSYTVHKFEAVPPGYCYIEAGITL